MDEWGNYRRTSKKNYIIWQLLIGTIELGLFVYFFFVTQRWGNMADDANEKKSPEKPKEEDNENKKDEKPKDDEAKEPVKEDD